MIQIIFIYGLTFVSCDTRKTNHRTITTHQNFLDYLYDWNYADKFSHPQYDAEIHTIPARPDTNATMMTRPVTNATMVHRPDTNATNTTDDEKAKLVRHELTKYALDLFKVMAKRSFEQSRLDLKKDLNYTDGNVNEFIIKWYLKEVNRTRGDIFLTKGNSSAEVRGKELNNLIIMLLNKKLSKSNLIDKQVETHVPPIDETLRNLDEKKMYKERLRYINKERIKDKAKIKKMDKHKIDITKLNTSNYEYLMLNKIKENYKNKKFDDPYINLSDLDKQFVAGEDKPTPFPERQFHPPQRPGIDSIYPHPENPMPGRPADYPPGTGGFLGLPVNPATIYPPNPQIPLAFPSPEQMGFEMRPGEPGYTGYPGIPGPPHGPRWTPPTTHFGPTGMTPRPIPGESPRPTPSLPPSVHGDPARPFGSLIHHNPRPRTTTRDPFFEGLLQDMQAQKNGYLTTFAIKLFEYIAIMRKEYAGLLIRRLEPVLGRLHEQRQLITFGEPLTTKLLGTARLMSAAPADVVQSHAATAHYALTHRRTYLSSEINGIIDYADTLYNDLEGQKLLKTLNDVRLFPNITKTAAVLANEMLDEALLSPYRRMTGTHKIQVLFDSINNAIIKRFHGIRRNFKLKKRDGKSSNTAQQSTFLNMYLRRHRKQENKSHKNEAHRKHKTIKGKIKRIKYKQKNNLHTKNRDFHENIDNYEKILKNKKNALIQINESHEETRAKSKIINRRQHNSTNISKNKIKVDFEMKINKTFNGAKKHIDYKPKGVFKSKTTAFKRKDTFYSDYSIEERDFKIKVKDALRHGDMVENVVFRIGRKNIAKPKNKINYFSSYSDEEGVIKQNIYKVFSGKLN